MIRKIGIALTTLACLLAAGAAAQAVELRGFEAGSFQYVSFGVYPREVDGAAAPLVWQVLRVEEGVATLLSLEVIDFLPAHDVSGGYSGWEKSSLRSWLNEDFLTLAFTDNDQAALVCREDSVPVSLPEAAMMKDAALGFSGNSSRKAQSTAYAWSHTLSKPAEKQRSASYWLRDRSTSNAYSQRRVMEAGSLGYAAADANKVGVRPVIAIDLESLSVLGGNGEVERPVALTVTDEAIERIRMRLQEAQEAARAEEEALLEARAREEREREEKRQEILAEKQIALLELEAMEGTSGNADALEALRQRVAALDLALLEVEGMVVDGFPPLTREGFLPSNQEVFTFVDEEQGVWRYASETLRIEIRRYFHEEEKLRWFEAEVYCADGERFVMYQNDPENRGKMADMSEIARRYGLVFAMNGDYYIYRVAREKQSGNVSAIGRIIRNGEVYYDHERKRSWTKFPNLDILALYPDGDMKVFYGDEISAADLLASGVENALAFGPFLIRDGLVNEEGVSRYGKTRQPRAGMGMVSPGHYYAIVVESRTSKSKGAPVSWLAERFQELGCSVAFNLDGGQTAVMIFLGEQINEIGKYDGKTNSRLQNEVLGLEAAGW